jgi:hypothetical protein
MGRERKIFRRAADAVTKAELSMNDQAKDCMYKYPIVFDQAGPVPALRAT